ncbi:MAG: alpha/beta fold hydrolase [Caldilineaceae bacterium]|nr:alpha/beta fold hydrolase [Caldilineaceae bacterium]
MMPKLQLRKPKFGSKRGAVASATLSPFRPHRLLRGGRIQTFASSYPARRLKGGLTDEQVVVLDAGHDATGYDASVRLVGYYNRRDTSDASRGLVISLHGWEGNSHSPYGVITGRRLLAEGYDLFRLNLRDHGPRLHVDPYALNQGLFLGTLIEETLCAVQQVAVWAKDLPVYIVGPSLGGNFALRLAMLHATQPIANLRRVVAISPAINPSRSTDRIDSQYPFRRYFRNRWLRSVLAKERLFPHLYDFHPLLKMSRLRPMTEWLVQHYSDFSDAEDYFGRYSVLGDALAGLTVPTTILTAADDPVIVVEDFERLTASPLLDLKIEPFGGHVGFVDLWPLHHLLPEMILAELSCE